MIILVQKNDHHKPRTSLTVQAVHTTYVDFGQMSKHENK